MLKITNLSHRYGSKWVLNNVNLSIEAPQICALLGRNGAGKSTTLKCIAGLLTPTQGQIWVCSNPVLSSIPFRFYNHYKKELGYLPETSPLYPEMTVWGYLKWIGRLRKIERHFLDHRIDEIAQICGLSSFLKKQIGLLSKGMKQRVCLAQALIHSPSVLLLDEIYSGLDPHQADEIQDLLLQLKTTTSILLSTHQLSRAQEVADQVVILEKGEVCGSGSIDALSKTLNQHAYTLIVDHPLLILVILLVLFLALKALVFNPFLDDLDQRDVRTEQVRQTADELKKKADSLAEQYQAEVAQARTQAQEARRTLRVAGLEDKDTRVAAAQKEANENYESASASLSNQFEEAQKSALSQVDDLARQITSKVLGREV